MSGEALRSGPVSVRVDTAQFRALFGKTSQVDKKLKTALRKNIREVTKAIVKDVQAEVLKPPTYKSAANTKSTGLRKNIAANVKVKINTGAKPGVTIVSSGLMARGYDGTRRWRHPVFGNFDVWTSQFGRPYFRNVIEPRKDEVRKAVADAMEEALRSLK